MGKKSKEDKVKGRVVISFPGQNRVPFLCKLMIKYIIAKGGRASIVKVNTDKKSLNLCQQ